MQNPLVNCVSCASSDCCLTTGKLFACVLQNPPRSRGKIAATAYLHPGCFHRAARAAIGFVNCTSITLSLIYNAEVERQDAAMDEPLRPLTSLKWPYIPEESAYPDPLKRDDPKVVQLAQYEAIGNSLLLVHNMTDENHVFD